MRRIVVGLDFSDVSDRVVEAATVVARAFTAVLDLVHVRRRTAHAAGVVAGRPDDEEGALDRIDEALAGVAARVVDAGVPCVTTSLRGAVAARLVRHVDHTGADLIVLGAHGRSALQHVVRRNLADRMIHRTRVPILVVPMNG